MYTNNILIRRVLKLTLPCAQIKKISREKKNKKRIPRQPAMGAATEDDSVQVYSRKKNGYFHHLYGSAFYGAVMRKRVSKNSFNKINNNGIYSLNGVPKRRGRKSRGISAIKKRDDVIEFQTGDLKSTREEEDIINIIKESVVLSSSGQENVTAVDQVNHQRFWTKPRCRVLLPTEKFRFTIDMDQDLSDSDLCFGDNEDQDYNW
ncbi:hypothetical protein ABFS82_09G063300 [Erythranthe guttata]